MDSSGNGLHGTALGKPIYRPVPAVPNSNRALRFDGLATRVSVPDHPQFELTRCLTLEAYVMLEAYPQNTWEKAQIVFRGDDRGGLDPYFLCVTSTGQLLFHIQTSSRAHARLTSPKALPLKAFYHVAATLDDATGEQKLFINGKEVASQITSVRPLGPLDAAFDPGIGMGNIQSWGLDQHFRGIIDEVRISNVALPPTRFLPPVLSSPPTIPPLPRPTVPRKRILRPQF